MSFAWSTVSAVVVTSTPLLAKSNKPVGELTYPGNPRAEVIYGEDDRMDLFDQRVPEDWRRLARSTAILIKDDKLEVDPGRADYVKIDAKSFGDSMGLCPTEPFREQPTPGFCSGFLVGPDILVTAGHCITEMTRCQTTSFVFDYGYHEPLADLSSVPASNVYHCDSIIARDLDRSTQSDFAVIRLDRPVEGRQPLTFRKTDSVSVGTELVVIGHPTGLPTKIAGGAQVRKNNDSQPYFVANLDTYGGNSGSAVFNAVTGDVEGILVRGENDFRYVNGCTASYHCANDGCRGEDVTKASIFAQYIDEDGNAPQESSQHGPTL